MKRWLLVIALLLSLVMFSHTTAPPAPAVPIAPQTEQRTFMLKVVDCPEATACLFNVVGKTGVLARQVGVWVGSYQAPSAHYYGCRLEQFKGKRAAAFLEETLKGAEYVILVNAHKKRGSPYLSGTLVVDGRDITVKMFEMLLAVPKGIKVDWCEKLSRGFEV